MFIGADVLGNPETELLSPESLPRTLGQIVSVKVRKLICILFT